MVRHFNTEMTVDAQRIFKPKGEGFLDEVGDIIQPTKEVKSVGELFSGAAVNTTAVLHTTRDENDKRFNVSAVSLQLVQRVAGAAITPTALLRCTQKGVVRNLAALELPTNLVGDAEIAVSLPAPVRCDQNTDIDIITAGDASSAGRASVVGFYE